MVAFSTATAMCCCGGGRDWDGKVSEGWLGFWGDFAGISRDFTRGAGLCRANRARLPGRTRESRATRGIFATHSTDLDPRRNDGRDPTGQLRARSTPRLPRRFKKPSAETVEMREVGGRTLNSFGAVWATYAAWCEGWWVRYQRVRLESFVRVPRTGAARTLAWLRTLVVFSPFAYLESFANVEDMALDADLYLRPGLATWGREKTTSAEASDANRFCAAPRGTRAPMRARVEPSSLIDRTGFQRAV